jgi:hypothetical protein
MGAADVAPSDWHENMARTGMSNRRMVSRPQMQDAVRTHRQQ